MARTVSQGEDGFWRVSGQPTDQYYETQAQATRVAANLDAAEQPTAEQPATPVSEAAQNAALGPSDATITHAVISAGAGGTQKATAQLKNATGGNLGSKAPVRWWLSDGNALGEAEAGSVTDASVTVGVSIGQPATVHHWGDALTDDTGKLEIVFTGAGVVRFNIASGRLAKAAADNFADQTPLG